MKNMITGVHAKSTLLLAELFKVIGYVCLLDETCDVKLLSAYGIVACSSVAH